MAFRDLIGNEAVKRALQRAVRDGRIGQALLFSGPEGVGKRQFALALAKTLNCLEAAGASKRPSPSGDSVRSPRGVSPSTTELPDSCDACPSCRKFERGEHVDLMLVRPETSFFKIEQIRHLCENAYRRPREARVRVFILDGAEAMTEQAANALLKTLEEPPETSLFILLTSHLVRLLPTIRSRCQIYHFSPLTSEEIERFLRERFMRPEEEIRLLARLASGRIGRALEIDLSVYREMRREALELLSILAAGDRVRAIRAAEYLGRRLDRDQFEQRIRVFEQLLGDMLRLHVGSGRDPHHGVPEEVMNVDLEPHLRRLMGAFPPERIHQLLRRLATLRRDLLRNVNRQLALEALLLAEIS